MLISLYQIFSVLITPVIHIMLLLRKLVGKEDEARFRERLGYAAVKRGKGFLIWIHAASVGEALSVLSLIDRLMLHYPKISILLTTGTVSSTKMIIDKLPPTVIHQYAVIDNYYFVRRFLKHWAPNMAIFVESELWPNLLTQAFEYGPLILVNARMSDKSFRNWSYIKFFAKQLLDQFDLIVTQSKKDQKKFKSLGAKKIVNIGNLKYSNTNITVDQVEFNKLSEQIHGRQVFLAASTHYEDEEIIYKTHLELKSKHHNLLTIIAPRHPDRTSKIIDHITEYNIKYVCRTNLAVITADTEVYLANTLGEMGLFYNLADIIFIGGSFVNGGHNPIEAASFNKPIIFGPDMSNFSEIAEEFIAKNAAIQVQNQQELTTHLNTLLNTDSAAVQKLIAKYTMNAVKILTKNKQILDSYIKVIGKYIPINSNV